MINDGHEDPDFQSFSQVGAFFKESVYELCRGKFMKVLMPEIIKMNCA